MMQYIALEIGVYRSKQRANMRVVGKGASTAVGSPAEKHQKGQHMTDRKWGKIGTVCFQHTASKELTMVNLLIRTQPIELLQHERPPRIVARRLFVADDDLAVSYFGTFRLRFPISHNPFQGLQRVCVYDIFFMVWYS